MSEDQTEFSANTDSWKHKSSSTENTLKSNYFRTTYTYAQEDKESKKPDASYSRIEPWEEESLWQVELAQLNDQNKSKFEYNKMTTVESSSIPSEARSLKHKEFIQSWSLPMSSGNAFVVVQARIGGRLNKEHHPKTWETILKARNYTTDDGPILPSEEAGKGRFHLTQFMLVPIAWNDSTVTVTGTIPVRYVSHETGRFLEPKTPSPANSRTVTPTSSTLHLSSLVNKA
jgi:hypothetical protein